MTLFDPSVSVFVGDDKYTGNGYIDNNRGTNQPPEEFPRPATSSVTGAPLHYEVPVHVVLPFEMCDALYRQRQNSKFLEKLQFRLGNDVYSLEGSDILDAMMRNENSIKLTDSKHVNMIDSSRPPVHDRIEVDISYVTDAIVNTGAKPPQGDIKVPFVIKIPSERHTTGVSNMEIITPRDAKRMETQKTQRQFFEDMNDPVYESLTSYRPKLPLNSPRDDEYSGSPTKVTLGEDVLFNDPNESVHFRAKQILSRGIIPDDVSGIDHYKPPGSVYGGQNYREPRQNSAMRMSVRSFQSNHSAVMSKYSAPTAGMQPNSRYDAASTNNSVLNSGRMKTRRSYYSEPIYSNKNQKMGGVSKRRLHLVPDSFRTGIQEEDLFIKEADEDNDAMMTSQSNGYRPPHQRRVDKAKTITFYRNGDAEFPGYTTSVSTREFRSWETLLVFLSDKISLPYGVRYVYSIRGRSVQNVWELEDGQAYVCASGQFVPNIHFGTSHETKWKLNRKGSGGKMRNSDRFLLADFMEDIQPNRQRPQMNSIARPPVSNKGQARIKSERRNGNAYQGHVYLGDINGQLMMEEDVLSEASPYVVNIISNTHRSSRAKVLLNPGLRKPFVEILEDLAVDVIMSGPAATKLFTAKTGERVNSYKDIFARFRFHDTFIICGTESFKGRLNEKINLPPTILEDTVGTEQGHIPPHERRTTRGRYNANRVNDRKNVNRRPLRTIHNDQLTPVVDREGSVSPLILGNMNDAAILREEIFELPNSLTYMAGGRQNSASRKKNQQRQRVGENLVLDGEMERRRLFNDDMLLDEKSDMNRQGEIQNYHEETFDQGGVSHAEHSDAGVTYDVTSTELFKKEKDAITVHIHGKPRDFLIPSQYSQDDVTGVLNKPSSKLALEWVYGYRGYDSRMNLYCLPSGELCYYVGAVAVLYDKKVEVQRHYTAHNQDITSMAVHSSGTLIATGQKRGADKASSGHVRIWDTDSLSTHAILGLGQYDSSVSILAFSHNNEGEWLLSVDGGESHVMTIWNWGKETVIAKTKTCRNTVVCGSFSPLDDKSLITGGKQHLYFWRIINGKIFRDKKSGIFVDEIPHYITCLTFNMEGEPITGDSSGNIIVWGMDSRNIYYVKSTILRAHDKSVFALCHLADGTLLSGGGIDRRIIAWDGSQQYKSAKAGRQLPDAVGGVRMVATSPQGGLDGQLYVGTTKNVIIEGTLQHKFTSIVQGHFQDVWALATHPSEEFFATAGFDQQICMWNSLSHKLQWKVFTEKPCMTCLFHPSGSVVGVGQSSGRFIVLNSYSGVHVTSFHVATEKIDVAKMSPDGSLLAIGCHDRNIHLFEVQDNGLSYRRMGSLSGHNSFIIQMDWSDDSNFMQSVSANYNLLFWNISAMRSESSKNTKDISWSTHTSVLGFNVAGVWTALPKATNLVTCAISESQQLLAAGDSRGSLRIFQYPAFQNKNRGETSGTTSLLHIHTSSDWWFPDNSVFTSSGGGLCLNEE